MGQTQLKPLSAPPLEGPQSLPLTPSLSIAHPTHPPTHPPMHASSFLCMAHPTVPPTKSTFSQSCSPSPASAIPPTLTLKAICPSSTFPTASTYIHLPPPPTHLQVCAQPLTPLLHPFVCWSTTCHPDAATPLLLEESTVPTLGFPAAWGRSRLS